LVGRPHLSVLLPSRGLPSPGGEMRRLEDPGVDEGVREKRPGLGSKDRV
jgi:hypothetical protein